VLGEEEGFGEEGVVGGEGGEEDVEAGYEARFENRRMLRSGGKC